MCRSHGACHSNHVACGLPDLHAFSSKLKVFQGWGEQVQPLLFLRTAVASLCTKCPSFSSTETWLHLCLSQRCEKGTWTLQSNTLKYWQAHPALAAGLFLEWMFYFSILFYIFIHNNAIWFWIHNRRWQREYDFCWLSPISSTLSWAYMVKCMLSWKPSSAKKRKRLWTWMFPYPISIYSILLDTFS